MVLPFENLTPEDRRVEWERQRRLVFALPWAEPTADCLSSTASNMLDHLFRLEDAVLVATADAPDAAERLVILLAALRAVLPEATAMFGQSYAAARLIFRGHSHLQALHMFVALLLAGSAYVCRTPVGGLCICLSHSRWRALHMFVALPLRALHLFVALPFVCCYSCSASD